MLNAPSLANSNLLDLGSDVDRHVRNGIRVVHIDLMDGHYVPNLCFPISVVRDIKQRHPELVVDAHLMVDDVENYIDRLAAADCDAMSFPADGTRFVRRTIRQVQDTGMRAGVAINPSQPITTLAPYLEYLDFVVLMTVEPGFAGQRFLDGSLERLAELAALKEQVGSTALIEIDGGVDYDNAAESLALGAEILVTNVYTVYDPDLGLEKATAKFETAMNDAGFGHSDMALERLKRVR